MKVYNLIICKLGCCDVETGSGALYHANMQIEGVGAAKRQNAVMLAKDT